MNFLRVFALLTLETLLSLDAIVSRPNASVWPIVRAVTGLLFLIVSLRNIAAKAN